MFLVQLYGEKCAACNDISEDRLDIDHIDENPLHHFWKNLQLLCHRCNCKKRSKQPQKIKGRIKVAINNNLTNANAETHLKSLYLISFLNFIEDEFRETNQYNYKTLLTDASLSCGFASEETIKRYVRQLCSPKFGILEKVIDDRTGVEYIKLVGTINDLRNKISW